MKKCRKCGDTKPLTDFGKDKGFKDGLKASCKTCTYAGRDKTKAKAWREERRDELNAYRREWGKENVEHVRQKNAEHYEANKEERKEQARLWRLKNPERARMIGVVHSQKRRAMAQELPNDLTLEQWTESVAHFNDSCAYCGKEAQLTQEHVVPQSKGGGYTADNIIPACGPCNYSKQAKDMEEWYRSQPFFGEYRLLKIKGYLEACNICVY